MSVEIPISLKYAKPTKTGWYKVSTATSENNDVRAYYQFSDDKWFWNDKDSTFPTIGSINNSLCYFYAKSETDWELKWTPFNIVDETVEKPITMNAFLSEFTDLEMYGYLRKKYKEKTLKDFISDPAMKEARKHLHVDDLILKTCTEETTKLMKIFGQEAK